MEIKLSGHHLAHRQFINLLKKASEIGYELEGYGEIAYNENSGFYYAWNENYSFCLAARDYEKKVIAFYTDPETGSEYGIDTKSMESIEKKIEKIQRNPDKQSNLLI